MPESLVCTLDPQCILPCTTFHVFFADKEAESWGWRDSLVVDVTCSCRGLRFSSQHKKVDVSPITYDPKVGNMGSRDRWTLKLMGQLTCSHCQDSRSLKYSVSNRRWKVPEDQHPRFSSECHAGIMQSTCTHRCEHIEKLKRIFSPFIL